jgi:hypothetical protein
MLLTKEEMKAVNRIAHKIAGDVAYPEIRDLCIRKIETEKNRRGELGDVEAILTGFHVDITVEEGF